MKIIGITGPTGAGKTTALLAARGLGAFVIDADAVYHDLLSSSSALRDVLSARFGNGILSEDGMIDRKKLGEIVFQDEEALLDLNAIAHRFVEAEISRLFSRARADGCPAAVIDAIALLESGLPALCSAVVGVLAPKEVRIARIMQREGISLEYARMRVAAQKDDSFFRARCHYILENDERDTPESFGEKARALFMHILTQHTPRQPVVGSDGGGAPAPRLDAESQYWKGEETMEDEKKEKSAGDLRREALFFKRKNGYDRIGAQDENAMKTYCEEYKKFLDEGKTERECVQLAVSMAEAKGFQPFQRGMALSPGDKIYRVNRGRAVVLAVLGSAPMAAGVNITAAHIDSPRLDLKQNPLYEENELAFFKTHYYGGIRKYQWVTIPLELRGVVVLRDGGKVKVSVGGAAGEPVFTIGDLLPHLSQDQQKKPLGEAIPAESLNILVGSRPFRADTGADRVRLSILELLNQKYGIVEEDFTSAELIAVPAFAASDIGFDRSMIGAYGQDDRVCSYACLAALLDLERPLKTAVCALVDKEEIGSEGISGMKAAAFDTFMSDLCDMQRIPLKTCYENSFCLSADVCAAFDPNFPEVFDKRNSAFVNYGIGICKYSGTRGKSGASDATAEAVAYARKIFDDAGVIWQTCELGKADQGGGGTVAAYLAERDIDTLDAGVPVLSMHSPFETVSKLDCYMMFKAAKAVYQAT